jgi:hypothetical protein
VSSYSWSETFSRTHARRLAGRVTADLRQSHFLYGSPSESRLEDYREELEELLTGGYVARYQFGFSIDETLVWSMRYVVGPDGSLAPTVTAGGVPAGIDVKGATFFNFLTFSDGWYELDPLTRKAIEGNLPFIRTVGALPSEVGGYWVSDRTYAAGGVALERAFFRRLAA